jgi:hypothetical protein
MFGFNCQPVRCRPAAVVFLFFGALISQAEEEGIATVRHAPQINGRVEGSVRQFLPESPNLNGGAVITDDLLVPGTPTVRQNGHPNYQGTVDENGRLRRRTTR